MTDQLFVYGTAAVIVVLILSQIFRRSFDPFAPVWLFLTGYGQIYVAQAITCREYGLHARGVEIVTEANARALWALVWFLAVYFCGLGRLISARLPRPPQGWSTPAVVSVSPLLIVWGLICAGVAIRQTGAPESAEASLLRQFPTMMLAGGVLLIVTGRQPSRTQPHLTAAGIAVVVAYVLIWMFNAKRSHSLFGVLTGICAFYTPGLRRPSLPILGATAMIGVLVVSLAIGWRGNGSYEQSAGGFLNYVSEFDPSSILVNLSLKSSEDGPLSEPRSRETDEYGAFLLMMDTVPEKSPHDYGASYLRVVSTYIPRLIWRDKPLYGREQWVSAWIAGSEFPRDASFTGPAIGILGACQLNGGAVATVIVMAAVALMLRTSYDYYRYHALNPWAQVWWALTFYNAWMLTANDDPLVWFYYNYGHTTLPPLAFFWIYNALASRHAPAQSRAWEAAAV